MAVYPASARERAMKVEEVILRALSKQITFWQAAHIARISPRHLRRLYERYRRYGFDGLYDRRKGRPSPRRVPWAVAEQVLCLYREVYFDTSTGTFTKSSVRSMASTTATPVSSCCCKVRGRWSKREN